MPVTVYGLSTCPYCRMTRTFLDEGGVEYEDVEVDKLEGQERTDTVEEVRRLSGGASFPVVVVGDEVIVGFDKVRIKKVLGL